MAAVEMASVEAALDRFMSRWDELESDGSGPFRLVRLLGFSLTFAGVGTLLEFARRRALRVRQRGHIQPGACRTGPVPRGMLVGFPELPTSWSRRRA
jgi:hypothetical protein